MGDRIKLRDLRDVERYAAGLEEAIAQILAETRKREGELLATIAVLSARLDAQEGRIGEMEAAIAPG